MKEIIIQKQKIVSENDTLDINELATLNEILKKAQKKN